MINRLLIILFLTFGTALQPALAQLPCCCEDAPAEATEVPADPQSETPEISSCCSSAEPEPAEQPNPMNEGEDDCEHKCNCLKFCCRSSMNNPLCVSSIPGAEIGDDPFARLPDDTNDLCLAPHTLRLKRPPRA